MNPLTEQQVNAVKTTWEIPKANPLDSGEAILLRLFTRYPHNQDKFSAFKNTPLQSLKGSTGFRTHAGRVIKTFDLAIDALGAENSLQSLQEIWTKIAESHKNRGISKQAFLELREVATEVLAEACSFTPDQEAAWIQLFDNIYHIVFEKMDSM